MITNATHSMQSSPESQDIPRRGGDVQNALYVLLNNRESRIDSLYHIRNEAGKVIPYVRNEAQLAFDMNMWYLNIILKDRQRGFSTHIAIDILDRALWNSHYEAGVIDITLPDARKKLDKVKLAYDHLLPELQELVQITERNKESLAFSNGSSIYIGTSHRGGTLSYLHVSEMGKIAARNPDRAREIRTGAFNTIAEGNIITIESTAEGTSGEFYDDCKRAENHQLEGKKLTYLDFQFHFHAWWMGNKYELDPEGVDVSSELTEYFDGLEKEIWEIYPEQAKKYSTDGRVLTLRKRAWYAKKSVQQKDDMKREYPSTAEEAFQASVEGAYLSKALRRLRGEKKITVVPADTQFPVNTGWDFGVHDYMTVWLHQRIGFQERLIGYHEWHGDDIIPCWKELSEMYPDYVWGKHFLPHDAGHKRIGTATGGQRKPRTLQQLLKAAGMLNSVIVPRIDQKATAIAETRGWLPNVWIDAENCERGINHLQNYKKDWDDKLGVWKNSPRHDEASHGYDSVEALARGLNLFGTRLHFDRQMNQKKTVSSRHTSRRPSNWRTA